jgi:hypothetical protein
MSLHRSSRISPGNKHAQASESLRPNPPMQPTPLRGPEIAAILKSDLVPSAVLIYPAARLMGRA